MRTGMSALKRGLMACAAFVVSYPTIAWSGDKEDLLELEQKRYDALIAEDWAAYDALLGDEFFHAHVLGGILEKAPHFEHLKNGKSKVKKAVLEDLDVRLYGDVAVVIGVSHVDIVHTDLAGVSALTGVSTDDLNKKGAAFTRSSRHMHVWVKREGNWKLVARQATNLPEQQ
jgi:ketosteroid isomerase-like protein